MEHPIQAKIAEKAASESSWSKKYLCEMIFDNSQQLQTDKALDPELWNQEWESFLANPERVRLHHDVIHRLPKKNISPAMISGLEREERELYADQVRLNMFMHLAWKMSDWTCDLEMQWLNYSPETRRGFLLEGLVKASDFSELNRVFCPDLTLSHLEENSGQRFLDYLSMLVSRKAEKQGPKGVVQEPIFIALPDRFSNFKQSPGPENQAALYYIALHRASFLFRFLGSTIGCCFVNNAGVQRLLAGKQQSSQTIPETILEGKHQDLSQSILAGDANMASADLTKPAPTTVIKPEVDASGVPTGNYYRLACNRALCGLKGIDAPASNEGSKRLQACSRCAAIERKIFYCSRECQKLDWKRHKVICGKPDAVPERIKEVKLQYNPRSPSAFPPPVSGFIRSAALVSQMAALSFSRRWDVEHPDDRHLEISYILRKTPFDLDKDSAASLIIDQKSVQIICGGIGFDLFRFIRNYAFQTGNLTAVAWLCNFLCGQQTSERKAITKTHFCAEFEITLTTLEDHLKPPLFTADTMENLLYAIEKSGQATVSQLGAMALEAKLRLGI